MNQNWSTTTFACAPLIYLETFATALRTAASSSPTSEKYSEERTGRGKPTTKSKFLSNISIGGGDGKGKEGGGGEGGKWKGERARLQFHHRIFQS